MFATDFAPCSARCDDDAIALGDGQTEGGAAQGDLTAVGRPALDAAPLVLPDAEGLGQVSQSLQVLSAAAPIRRTSRSRRIPIVGCVETALQDRRSRC